MRNFLLFVIAVLAGLMLSELKKLNHPKRVQQVKNVPVAYHYAPMISEADLPKVVNP